MHDLEMHLTWRSIRLFGSFDPKERQNNYLEKNPKGAMHNTYAFS
jgi:hypothetical protein